MALKAKNKARHYKLTARCKGHHARASRREHGASPRPQKLKAQGHLQGSRHATIDTASCRDGQIHPKRPITCLLCRRRGRSCGGRRNTSSRGGWARCVTGYAGLHGGLPLVSRAHRVLSPFFFLGMEATSNDGYGGWIQRGRRNPDVARVHAYPLASPRRPSRPSVYRPSFSFSWAT